MILIQKGHEPRSLTEYRSQPGATYEGYRNKSDVWNSLLAEQGHICAYCMCRISIDNIKIEHWIAQNAVDGSGKKHDLEYHNMLGVCKGNESHPYNEQTCDAHRGNATLFVDPKNEKHISQIKYRGDGTIYSDNERIQNDLDKVLNLNCEQAMLKENRKQVIFALQKYLSQKQPQKTWNANLLRAAKNAFIKKEEGKYKPFVGAALYYIDHYLKKVT